MQIQDDHDIMTHQVSSSDMKQLQYSKHNKENEQHLQEL